MHRTGLGTVKDLATAIIDSGGCGHYWAELAMIIDGKKVNLEAIVTFIDGVPCGQQFKPPPKWKKLIRRFFGLRQKISCYRTQ